MLSVQSLRNPPSRQAVYAWLVELLKAAGFETTGWQRGRIQRALLYTISTGVADLAELGKVIVEFGFNDTASGEPLNEFSKSRFDNTKTPAVKAQGPMRLASVANIPYTITPGQLIAATDSGVEFRNITGGVLPAGSTLAPATMATPLVWEARLAGSNGNVSNGSVTRLLTPLAGVTISNDVLDANGNWYTTAGADEESDASIQQRNKTKWPTLALALIREGFENVARSGGAMKVYVDDTNPRGAGTVDVYVAGTRAELGTDVIGAIQNLFAKRWFRTDPYPANVNTSRVYVRTVVPQYISLAGGVVYYDPSVEDVQANVIQALNDLADATPLGGWDYSPGPSNILTRGDLLHAIENVEGVRTAVLPLAADISIGSLRLVVPAADDWDLEFVPVTS
jgi:uncharacterized phage protein gp47/JayE